MATGQNNQTGGSAPNRATSNVTVKIFIEGADVTAQPGGLMSLSIFKEYNKIPTARLLFEDNAAKNREFRKSNTNLFVPGKQIDIQLGYNQETESIFRGIIVRHGVKVLSGKSMHLEIECKDLAVKTTLIRKSEYFYNSTDTDVIRQIVRNYSGLQVGNITDSTFNREELVQFNCTDWDFMVMRADTNGLLVNVLSGEINIVKPEISGEANLTVQLGPTGNGIPLVEIEAEIDARTHFPSVSAKAWDFARQEVVEAEKMSTNVGQTPGVPGGFGGAAALAGSAGLGSVAGGTTANPVSAITGDGDGRKQFPEALYGNDPVLLYHGGDLESRELEAWAEAKMMRGDFSNTRGRVRIRGIKVNPGDTIALEGIGDRFDGKHLVSGVMHQVYGGTWQSDIQFGLSDKFFSDTTEATSQDASGLLPGIRGLHIGIVSKLDGDSQPGDHRIQVRIPSLAASNGSQSDGIWARLSTLYAGNDRGWVCRPEVGDEVVLGFVNNDPNQAIVLGSLHNNQNSAPIPATSDNFQKVFKAKEGMELIFDDQQKSITLKTDNGRSLILSDQDGKITLQDQNGNSIELSASGINITSSGRVSIQGTPINLN